MSRTIDSRVVEMRFDNKEFERDVATSMSTLEKLKRSLNLDGASKGLDNVSAAAKNVNMSSLGEMVDAVNVKFSNLQVIGVTALANITNSAVNAGKRIASSLLGPLTEGGKTRALNIEQAKFQFKGLGMDIEATMADANYAVSDTAFTLDAAAKVAAQLGASGMRAGEDMRKALRGISGVAAMSSSSYEDIGSVFTKVAGQGRLMGDDLLRLSSRGINAAATIAKHFGKTEAQIREMVTAGKVDFAMFAEAMDSAFGEHAKAANETFTGSLANMKAALSRIGEKFYTPLHANLITPLNTLKEVFKDIGTVIDPIFPALTSLMEVLSSGSVSFLEGLNFEGLSKSVEKVSLFIANFAESLKAGSESGKDIMRTFKGVFALFDIGVMAATALGKGIFSIVQSLFPVAGSFLSVTGSIGDFIVAIRDALKISDSFSIFVSNFVKILKPIADGIAMFANLIAIAFKSVKVPEMTAIDNFTTQVEKSFQPLIKLSEGLSHLLSFFYNIAITIGSIFKALSNAILTSLNTPNFDAIFDFINSGLIAGILYALKKFIDSLTGISKRVGAITGIFDGVRGVLQAYQTQLKAGILLKIATAVGILAAALMVISLIDSKKLTVSLAAMTAMFVELFGAMAVFNAIAGVKGFFAITAMTTGMIGLSIAVLVLASAMKKISDVDWPGLLKGLLGVAGLTGILVGATKLLETSSKSLIRSSIGFIIFGTAILILTQAVKQLGGLDLADLTKGLVGVGALMAGLVLFMKVADFSGMGAIKSIGILILATAITVLANAVKKMSSINLVDLAIGLGGLAVILTTIVLFMKSAGDAKHVIATATSLTILGVAINILATALIKMGSTSWDAMARGLISLGVALGVITLAFIALPKNIFIQSLAIMDVAGAMFLLSQALKAFSSMSWEEIARSLTVLIVSLGVIIGAFVLLSKTSSIVDSLAFSMLALSITILAGALKTIGSLSLAELGVALLGLAGAFTVIGVAAKLLTPAIPAIFGLAAAIGILGIGIAAIGAGVLALSTGLAALAVAGTAGTVALVALITSLIGMIPAAARILAEGVIEFARVIGAGAPVVAQAIKDVILAVMDVIVTLTPVVVDGLLKLLTQLLKSLLKYMPNIIKVGGELIVAFLKGVAANIQDVVEVGIDLIINFIQGVMSKIGDIVQAGFDLMIAFINGLAIAVEKNGNAVVDAILNLIKSIITVALETLRKSITFFVDIGRDIVMGLLQGIKDKIFDVVTGVKDLAQSAIDAAREALRSSSPSKEFEDIGLDIGEGLAIGINNSIPTVVSSTKKMIEKVIEEAEKAAKTAKERVKTDAEKAAEEIARAGFNAAIDWIDERKYYSELSLHEELDAWEYVQKRYLEGTEERKRADREVYRVKKEIAQDWINERKYYNELSLYEELDAWERVQSRYLEGTEERKKADREVYRVKKEIAQADIDFAQRVIDVSRDAMDKRIQYEQEYLDACRRINDQLERDIRDLNEQYEQALESRTKSLYDTYGLFEKVEPKDEVLGSDLINNLRDQVNEFDEWTRQMSELSSRGVDSALIDELQKMGPRSLSEIKALNKLSEPELIEYVSLWREKSNQARTVATKELEGLRIETSNKIRMLNEQARIDLEEQRLIFEEKTKQLAEETAKTIEDMKNDWLKKIGELRTKGEKDFKMFADNIVTIMSTPDWMGLGQNIVDGMKGGILSKASELAKAAAETAIAALEAAKDAIGVASPSKKFAELGKWSMVGFAEGLKKYSHLGMSSAADMGMSTISTLRDIISAISDVINDDADIEPVIRPVLDLSDVEAGSLLINDLLSKNKGINVANVMRKLPTFATSSESDGVNRSETPQEIKVSYVQNNYSPKALSRLEIYRQTKNQISTLRGLRGVIGTT